MAEKRFRVTLTEYESGWGSKDFTYRDFDTLSCAKAYQKEVNDENDKDYVPDYYIVANEPEEVLV